METFALLQKKTVSKNQGKVAGRHLTVFSLGHYVIHRHQLN